MKLSVIIPVYNSDKYLDDCLKSVFKQDFDKCQYEVIVINDGSVDNSKNIILSFQKNNSNLIFIDQKNQGVSVARNAGLEIAKGEYITFIDSDDEIFENSLEQYVNYAISHNLDLLYPKINYANSIGEISGEFKMDSYKEEILDGFHHQRRGFIVGFYRKELINNIRFNGKIPIAEDSLFNIEVHAVAKRCTYKNWPFYKYRTNIISASHSEFPQSEKAFKGIVEQLWCIHRLVKKNQDVYTESQIRYYDRPYYITIEMMLNVNIIPTISVSRLKILRREMKKLNIEYIADTVQETVPFFKSHWLLFFAYHSPKVIKYKTKTYIYQKLVQFKLITQ